MKKFKISYKNGFEIREAKDIFEMAAMMKKNYRFTFNMPVKIEEVV